MPSDDHQSMAILPAKAEENKDHVLGVKRSRAIPSPMKNPRNK